MSLSPFFRLFPPPAFLFLKYAGLEISDDAIRCLVYDGVRTPAAIKTYTTVELPEGLVEGGDVRDEKKLIELLAALREKEGLSYVKVSVPEEKMYIFQTTVPSPQPRVIRENIKSKLEENVPLSASTALFYFDALPAEEKKPLSVNVSAVPQSYVERRASVLKDAGLIPVGFEVMPKAIALAALPADAHTTSLVVHFMKHKTGLYYVMRGNIIGFTSTVPKKETAGASGGDALVRTSYSDMVSQEVERIFTYAVSRGWPSVDRIALSGSEAAAYEAALVKSLAVISIETPVVRANVWSNVFDLGQYVPPISRDESSAYAVAAGLALPA